MQKAWRNIRLGWPLIGWISLNLVAQPLYDTLSAEAAFQRGMLRYVQGYYHEAVGYFSHAIHRSEGQLVRAYTMRGASYLMSGQYSDALQDLRMAFSKDPTEYNALRFMVETFWAQGQYDSALQRAQQILNLHPNPLYHDYLVLARLYRFTGQPEKSFRAYLKAAHVSDTAIEPRTVIIYEYLQRGYPDSALRYIQQVLQQDHLNPDAMYNRGIAYALKKQYDSAVTALLTFLFYYPGDPQAYLALADAYRYQGKSNKAKKYYRYALAADSTLSLPYLSLAYLYQLENKMDSAVMTLIPLLEQDPQHPQANYYMGRILALQQRDEACIYLKRAANAGHLEAQKVFQQICRLTPSYEQPDDRP